METPATAPAFASPYGATRSTSVTITGDYVIIDGNPQVNLVNSPEIEGGVGTIAMCVNMLSSFLPFPVS
jgi:hypothetical protein